MAKGVLRYDNELNQISFRQWSSLESDLFMAILTKMQGKGTDRCVFDTDDLRDFIDFAATRNQRWEHLLTSVSQKVGSMTYVEQTDRKIRVMALFQLFEIDIDARTLTVEVSRFYEYIINKISANFTQIELEEFASLRSTYAKAMYRLLKQWRLVGKREFGSDEFRAYLGIPKSYDAKKITVKVLAPIQEELAQYFQGLEVETLRSPRRGRPITGYRFTWQAEARSDKQWVEGKFEKLPHRPESEKAKRARRSREAVERTEQMRRTATDRVEREQRAKENAAVLAEERERHGGSMFAGSKGYKPDGRAEDVPLF